MVIRFPFWLQAVLGLNLAFLFSSPEFPALSLCFAILAVCFFKRLTMLPAASRLPTPCRAPRQKVPGAGSLTASVLWVPLPVCLSRSKLWSQCSDEQLHRMQDGFPGASARQCVGGNQSTTPRNKLFTSAWIPNCSPQHFLTARRMDASGAPRTAEWS